MSVTCPTNKTFNRAQKKLENALILNVLEIYECTLLKIELSCVYGCKERSHLTEDLPGLRLVKQANNNPGILPLGSKKGRTQSHSERRFL